MNTAIHVKNTILAALSAIGTVITTYLGGWDMAVQTLVIFMVLDYITGLVVALVFQKSLKTPSGAADSRVSYRGILKKIAVLIAVGIAAMLDSLLHTPAVCRTAAILFFIGNEGLSICENIGLMGVPLPKFIKKALESLKNNNDEIKEDKSDE